MLARGKTREPAMLRGATLLLLTVATSGAAFGADIAEGDARYAPRRHYARPVPVDEDRLFTPADGTIPYIPPLVGRPFLPGAAALPGYYGSTHSYDYQGPYYGGPQVRYWNRLPYACGIYGYC
jgi:hypothetical protein